MEKFITEDFLLPNESARRLYHDYAADSPIIDYHCHLPPQEVAEDRRFENMTQIWLAGDHYKWRAMRAAGVEERFITGSAPDREKFDRWGSVAPLTVRHPLFHWTALELRRPFGIDDLYLNPWTAGEIWDRCGAMLATPEFSARGIMEQMNLRVVCSTDDPADDLAHHAAIARENREGTFSIRVLPTFRPDRAIPSACLTSNGRTAYRDYLTRLGEAARTEIGSLDDLLSVLASRHDYFHAAGCRLADHGFETFDFIDVEAEKTPDAGNAFAKIMNNETVTPDEIQAVSSTILLETARLHAAKGWAMQLHIGALRNNAARLFRSIGPDAGCDSMADGHYMRPLSRFLDRLDRDEKLPKTIVYNLNPDSSYALASMIANFNDGSIPGKMQYGSGWWFLDQFHGMREQLETVSTMGLLSQFIGMLTDSRSFLSYTRHEYFRRILCGLLGDDMERGLIPRDFDWIGGLVRDISYHNAERYFQF